MLALWFDSNRDGISQAGEVKRLSDPRVQVTAIYFKADRKDERNGDLQADLGFERLEKGKLVKGASVDWFAEVADKKLDLINKLVKLSQLNNKASENTKLPPPDKAKLSAPSSSQAPSLQALKSGINGLWFWKSNDSTFDSNPKLKPQGALSFFDIGNGQIRGHSYVETLFAPGQFAKSSLDVFRLSGTKEVLTDGQIKLVFAPIPGSTPRTELETTAIVAANGLTMSGSTRVKLDYDGKPVNFAYSWEAKKR